LSFKNRFLYISVIDEASDFKIGKQLGFAKAHHQISLEVKGVRGAPQNFGICLQNFCNGWGYSDFKFGALLEFAKVHHKSTRRRKGGPGLRELPKIWKFPFSIYTMPLKE